jgi:hypothetical protein
MRTRGRKARHVFWLGAAHANMQGFLDDGPVANRAELATHLRVVRAHVTQVRGPVRQKVRAQPRHA